MSDQHSPGETQVHHSARHEEKRKFIWKTLYFCVVLHVYEKLNVTTTMHLLHSGLHCDKNDKDIYDNISSVYIEFQYKIK